MGKVALYGGLVQLVEASSVQLLPQVEALSLLCLLPKPFMLTAHLQEVLVVRVVMGLSFTVGSLLLVDAGKAVSLLSPELEVHAALQIQAAVRLSERVPGEGWMGQPVSSRQRAHPHEGSHSSPVQNVQAAHLRHSAHGEWQ